MFFLRTTTNQTITVTNEQLNLTIGELKNELKSKYEEICGKLNDNQELIIIVYGKALDNNNIA